MHSILTKLLQKRKVEVMELDSEEKITFENWQKILSEEELTVDKIKEFCKSQIEIIENKWSDLNVENNKKAEWIPYHTVYKTLLTAISSPKYAREALEKQLNELVK